MSLYQNLNSLGSVVGRDEAVICTPLKENNNNFEYGVIQTLFYTANDNIQPDIIKGIFKCYLSDWGI